MRLKRSNSSQHQVAAASTGGGEVHLLDQPGVARALLQNVQANIYVADPQLRLVYMNDKATETTRSLSQDVYSALRPRLSELVDSGRPLPHDEQFAFGGVTLETHINRVPAPDGQTLGYVIAWQNVTDTVAALARAQKLAERVNETQEVSAAIMAVASATEQMASSSNEIARNATEASATVTEAVNSVEAANHTMTQLRDASGKINEIVQTITAVAEQTNLLALNATIEAARAGEAGKGFAVVAGEVKELSKQTKTATERITEMINSVQELSGAAAGAISAISTVVERVSRNQITIASAVEEQTATTKEISLNLSHAAQQAEGIAAFVAQNR